jgi:hypothetical protein
MKSSLIILLGRNAPNPGKHCQGGLLTFWGLETHAREIEEKPQYLGGVFRPPKVKAAKVRTLEKASRLLRDMGILNLLHPAKAGY